MKYRVMRPGISQREGRVLVDRAVGAMIEVSEEAAPALVKDGYLEGAGASRKRREGGEPSEEG